MAYVDDKGSASAWLSRIDAALRREDTWRKRAKKVIKRYRDERGRAELDSKINILWANTEVLKASLFTRMPRADVRRRFPDAAKQNSATRFAAEILERAIDYVVDVERADESVSAAIDDQLLPGRGVCWWSYEPEIEDGPPAVADAEHVGANPAASGDAAIGPGDHGGGVGRDDQGYGVESGEQAPDPQGRIVSQTLCLDYVYWEDYAQGVARTDKKIPWKARRLAPSGSEFREQFPNAKRIPFNASFDAKDADGQSLSGEGGDDEDSSVEVWEIWDKTSRRRLYIARGYPDVLQEDDDPYHLSGFFPTTRPLYSITTTDKQEPIPEFTQYQDQALELDRVSTRITRLLDQMRWRGIYDASVDGENVLATLAQADDGEFLPYRNWMQLKEKGGIENAIGFWPIGVLVEALKELYVQRGTLIQAIYEITGISDIIRGSTDPGETKGAQVLKARFGSMRMQKRQKAVQTWIRDTYAIGAELIAEHFSQETLAEITQVELPTRMEMALAAPSGAGLPALPAGLPPPAAALPTPAVPAPSMMGMGGQMPPMNAGIGMGLPPQPMPQGGQPMQGGDPTAQPKKQRPTWEDVIDILRSDKTRGYRIDIETDQSAIEDAAEEKSARLEFAAALGGVMDKAYMAAMTAPQMLPVIKEGAMFVVRTYKAGRALEQSLEDAFDDLQANPPKAPQAPQAGAPVNPMEAQAKMMESAAKIKEMEAKIALETQKLATETEAKRAELQAKIAADQAKLDLERQKLAAEIQAAQASHGLEQHKAQSDIALRAAAHNKGVIDEQTLSTGQPALAGENPIVAMLAQMQQMVGLMAESQQAIAQGQAKLAASQQALAVEQGAVARGLGQLAAAQTAPKRLVRGIDGRAVGVETAPQGVQ